VTNNAQNQSAFFLRVKAAGQETLLRLLDPEYTGTAFVVVQYMSRREAPQDMRAKNAELFTDTLRPIICDPNCFL